MKRVHSSPLVVEVVRGITVESSHLVDATVVDGNGRIVHAWGDAARMIMPRSAVKPIQALPLIETGAADRFELTDVELALACSSHSGQPDHVSVLAAWLAHIGLTDDALECGAQRPGHEPSARELDRRGLGPGVLHNNCSGKHLGFLTVCRHLGCEPRGYIQPGHPLQFDHVTPAIAGLCRVDLGRQVPAVDGCGIPAWVVPLAGLAAGWAGLADRPAGRRLLDAMGSEPFHVAGSDRLCTQLIARAGGTLVVKTGAEGVFAAVVRAGELGVALKARDGARRAAEAAIEWVLACIGATDEPSPRPLVNWAGTPVGEIRVRPPADGP